MESTNTFTARTSVPVVLGDEIADLADDGGRDCAEIDAFVDHDVQVDGYGIIGAERDLDTLAH